ncbi:hypothetical protein Patl1_22050 [Pistacia atlantica]|uniref:Uncharacterized protein n=1 Tax=Pistacia atlantica TaxID=434234 RepID=A0ACC1BIR5_9ROSI|nr:hypothetical protein Patl1_22050 [Pistacia atlantica]
MYGSGGRCDRILWYGKGVKQLSYFRSESKFSDHRPVSALFSAQVEVMKSTNSRGVEIHTLLPSIIIPEKTGQEKTDEEEKSTLLSLIVKDMESSPTHIKNL